MRMCEFVDEWYVLRTTQNGEFVGYQSSGKRLWKAVCRCRETSALRARSCAVGAVCARGAQFSHGLPCSSVVSSIYVTVQWTVV